MVGEFGDIVLPEPGGPIKECCARRRWRPRPLAACCRELKIDAVVIVVNEDFRRIGDRIGRIFRAIAAIISTAPDQ